MSVAASPMVCLRERKVHIHIIRKFTSPPLTAEPPFFVFFSLAPMMHEVTNFLTDETFDAESRHQPFDSDAGGFPQREPTDDAHVTGILSIAVLPFMDPKPHRFVDPNAPSAAPGSSSAAAKEKFAAYKSQATGVLARFAPQVAQAIAAADIQYVITSKIAAEFAFANSPRGGKADPTYGRPRIYRVRRTLEHLLWFRSMMHDKVPYGVLNPLPVTKEDAHSRDGVDQVVTFLSIFSSCPELKSDPFFWSLLTKPDDEFQELFTTLKPTGGGSSNASPSTSTAQHVSMGSMNAEAADAPQAGQQTNHPSFSARSFMGALQRKLVTSAKKLVAPPKFPSKALKPDKISDMLMETGVIDRALMSLDKVSSCVKTSYYFEDEKLRNQPVDAAWEEAAVTAFQLRDALEAERDALVETANALRDLAFPSYWPWTRDGVMEDVRPLTTPAVQETPPRHAKKADAPAGGADGSEPSPPTTPASPPQIARPPPSQRLTHYLHRVANAAQEMGRLSLLIFGEEFAVSINLVRMTVSARTFSAAAAHERIFSLEHQPRPKGRGLCEIQAELNKLVAEGTGHEELEAFDAMDDEVTAIHEAVDEAVGSFQRHHRDALCIMKQRLARDTKELIMGQVMNWKSALLLLADLKTTLELDKFMDDEDLPFTNAPVVHNPSPIQKRRFEAQQHVWGQQVMAFNQQQCGADDHAQTTEAKPKSGFGSLLESRNAPKRRQALRFDDEGSSTTSGANPFDTEVEMTHAGTSKSGASPKGTAAATPERENSIQVLPEELQDVVNSQSKFLLERPSVQKAASAERPPEEVAFDDVQAKRDARKSGSWKKKPGGGDGWGAVAAADEEDPFRF